MPIEMSNKVILITEKPRITSPIKIALNSLNLDLVSDYPALTTISLMKAGIAKSQKTAFIRTALLKFINENGFPRAIIMDSQIDIGPGPVKDPGMLKIFKTFLIAYVILSKGKECKNLKGNFILLTKGDEFEREFGLGKNPHGAMNLLITENPEINFFIDELKRNKEHFEEIFSISLLDTELSSDMITENLTKFISLTPKGSQTQNSQPQKSDNEKLLMPAVEKENELTTEKEKDDEAS